MESLLAEVLGLTTADVRGYSFHPTQALIIVRTWNRRTLLASEYDVAWAYFQRTGRL